MTQRQKVVVDALNAEIAARYRAGTASVDDLLARELLDPPKSAETARNDGALDDGTQRNSTGREEPR